MHPNHTPPTQFPILTLLLLLLLLTITRSIPTQRVYRTPSVVVSLRFWSVGFGTVSGCCKRHPTAVVEVVKDCPPLGGRSAFCCFSVGREIGKLLRQIMFRFLAADGVGFGVDFSAVEFVGGAVDLSW